MSESAEKPTKVIKVKIWVYMQNNGDGSGSPKFFNSSEAAEKYAEDDNERMCEDIDCHTLEIDENGNLLNPDKRDEDDE